MGSFSSSLGAYQKGKSVVAKTLAASFKITGKDLRLPKSSGIYRSKKEPGVFIEKRKFRLSKRGEKKEIKSYRRKPVKPVRITSLKLTPLRTSKRRKKKLFGISL